MKKYVFSAVDSLSLGSSDTKAKFQNLIPVLVMSNPQLSPPRWAEKEISPGT